MVTYLAVTYDAVVPAVGQKDIPQLDNARGIHAVIVSVVWESPQQIQLNLKYNLHSSYTLQLKTEDTFVYLRDTPIT